MSKLLINSSNKALVNSQGKAYAVTNVDELAGALPMTIQTAAGKVMRLVRYGKCTQTSTPTPSSPVDIACNNGVLKARSQSGLPLGYTQLEYIASTGNGSINTGIIPNSFDLDIEIDVQYTDISGNGPMMAWGFMGSQSNLPRWGFGFYNTGWIGSVNATSIVGSKDTNRHTVILSTKLNAQNQAIYKGTVDSTSYYGATITSSSTFEANVLSIYLFARNNNGTVGNSASCKIFGFKIKKAGVLIHNLVPCKNANNVVGVYDMVTNTFMSATGTLTAGNPVSDPVEIFADGTPEVITLGQQTASVPDLLRIGDYADEADIIGGKVIRRCGMLVLDGTESWNSYNVTQGVLFRTQIPDSISNFKSTLGVLCNAYQVVSATVRASGTLSGSAKNYDFINDNYTTLDAWEAYLATQYANGTPVIVIYPLAEEITEWATPQSLQTGAGSNTITSNVADATTRITYKI